MNLLGVTVVYHPSILDNAFLHEGEEKDNAHEALVGALKVGITELVGHDNFTLDVESSIDGSYNHYLFNAHETALVPYHELQRQAPLVRSLNKRIREILASPYVWNGRPSVSHDWFHLVLNQDTPIGIYGGINDLSAVSTCVDKVSQAYDRGDCALGYVTAATIIETDGKGLEAVPVRRAIDSCIEREDADWAGVLWSDLCETYTTCKDPQIREWIDELDRFIRSVDVTHDGVERIQ